MESYSSSWGSYPSIFAMGHRAIKDLLSVDVNVEEKVDGSQFSFGLVEASPADIEFSGPVLIHPDPESCKDLPITMPYALKIRSKGCVMHVDAPEKMFSLAGETVRRLGPQLHPGWTYRGEFLAKPHHNALAYDRVPIGNIILFDINTGNQEFLDYDAKLQEATRLGLECVPRLFSGKIDSVDQFRSFLDTVSVLGGQNIEGVVVKPRDYNLFGLDKKCLMGKFVSEAFKEVHRKSWGENNPTGKDIIGQVTQRYTSAARWAKAVQHLREAGKLVEDVQDIGPLIREIPEDVLKECEEDIKEDLFKWAWPSIRRGLTAGFPMWYKDQLLRRSFESPSEQVGTGGADERVSGTDSGNRDVRDSSLVDSKELS